MKSNGHLDRKDTGMTGLQVLADIRTLLKDYYLATFTTDEKGLKIKFDNDQTFTITVKEKK